MNAGVTERPAWLDMLHRALDSAGLAAYEWPADIGEDDVLQRLLRLNHLRTAARA